MNSLLSSEEAFSCRLWNRGYWPIFVVQLQRSRAGRFLYLQDKYESRGSVGCNIDTIFGHRIVRTISPFLLLPPSLVTQSPSPNSFMAPTAEGGKPNRHEQRIWRASEGETNAFGKAFPLSACVPLGCSKPTTVVIIGDGPRNDRAARCMPDA